LLIYYALAGLTIRSSHNYTGLHPVPGFYALAGLTFFAPDNNTAFDYNANKFLSALKG
jgi:hypothetical protein